MMYNFVNLSNSVMKDKILKKDYQNSKKNWQFCGNLLRIFIMARIRKQMTDIVIWWFLRKKSKTRKFIVYTFEKKKYIYISKQ